MEITYFVDYKLYNGDSQGWAYKTELKTTNADEAIRKYGELIETYYRNAPFTFGCIIVSDMFGNQIEKKTWSSPAEPEPEPEAEAEATTEE